MERKEQIPTLVDGRINRAAFYMFYDKNGQVDAYVLHILKKLREHVDLLWFVSNSDLSADAVSQIEDVCDRVIIRVNEGFDVGAYKCALETLGFEALNSFDELIFLNYTFYGPLQPFSRLFDEMAGRTCGFWGITAHKSTNYSPFPDMEEIPFHIQSHFIVTRKNLHGSKEFEDYWRNMPEIQSYADSVRFHEALFTRHFHGLGYSYQVYMDPDNYESDHPIFQQVSRMVRDGCPIIKRRTFFHEPLYLENECIDLPAAIDYIENHTGYDVSLIWKNITRTTPLRDLYTNAGLIKVVDSNKVVVTRRLRLAVLVHVYYTDMLKEIVDYIENIDTHHDIHITTDTHEKARIIAERMQELGVACKSLKVVSSNAGRDISALLIECRELVLDGGYDYICRLHSKRSPQDGPSRGEAFKHHLFDNLLGSRHQVAAILDAFERKSWLGIVMPPTVHVGYPTLGHGWFLNRDLAMKVAADIGINVPFDEHTPLATYGSMYWFRPEALRRLFKYPWRWEDFEQDRYGDGDLPHTLERLITYCAQQDGFITTCFMSAASAEWNYAKLEYKYQRLSAMYGKGTVIEQIMEHESMSRQRAIPNVRTAIKLVGRAMKASLIYRLARAKS